MYSRQPKTGKLFAVFNTTSGKIKLNPGEVVASIQKTDGFFIEAGDASADLTVTANSTGAGITLNSSVAIPIDTTNSQVKGLGYIFTVSTDITAPSINITSPTTSAAYSTTTSTISLSGTASDNIGVSAVTWTSDKGGSGTAAGTTSWSITNLSLQTGANLITVTAKDAVNNTSTDTITVTYTAAGNLAPVITSVLKATGTVATTLSYQITATNSPTSFSAAGLPAGLSVNTGGLISGTPTTIGTSSVTISAANASGTGSASLALSVYSACDLNRDWATNVVDVQLQVNAALGVTACTSDLNRDGVCNVIDVQRDVNASLGGACVLGP